MTTFRVPAGAVITLDGREASLDDLLSGQYVCVYAGPPAPWRPAGGKRSAGRRLTPGMVPATSAPPPVAQRVEAFTRPPGQAQ
jgi:hypothetical protein